MVRSKKKKRDQKKNVGLDKTKFSKIKQEYHDYDYIDKLDDKHKEWLSRFTEEDLGARLNHPNRKIYRKQKDKNGVFHRNNARNRDIQSIAKASGKLDYKQDLLEFDNVILSDAIDELIDKRKEIEKELTKIELENKKEIEKRKIK